MTNLVVFDVSGTLAQLGMTGLRERGGRPQVSPYEAVLELIADRRNVYDVGLLHVDASARDWRPHFEEAGAGEYAHPESIWLHPRTQAEAFSSILAARSRVDGEIILVCESARRRIAATAAGLRTCCHPRLIDATLENLPVMYFEAHAPPSSPTWHQIVAGLDLVPSYIDASQMLGIGTAHAIRLLHERGANVTPLGRYGTVDRTNLMRIRFDRNAVGADMEVYRARLASLEAVIFDREGALAAIPGDVPIEAWTPPDAPHGSISILRPARVLLDRPSDPTISVGGLVESETRVIAGVDLARMRRDAHVLTGQSRIRAAVPTPDHAPIISRFFSHPGNLAAEDYIAWSLDQIQGVSAVEKRLMNRVHRDGTPCHNVVAEIPSRDRSGRFVYLCAHLDSTNAASESASFGDPAPGADDDASGVVAVLECARIHAALASAKKPRIGIRYVLFNAEEQLMVGSQFYAASLGVDEVVAMIQLDMVGYRHDPSSSIFEVHAGTRSAGAADLARLIGSSAAVVGQLPSFRPDLHIGAPNSIPLGWASDHIFFDDRGWPACLISQDMFTNTPSPRPSLNPEYHTVNDLGIHYEFTGAIARTAAAAVWSMAK